MLSLDARHWQTGRRIPQTVLQDTFRQVPRSVGQVRGLVDEYVEVDNDATQPELKTSRDVRALLRVCRAVGGDCESVHLEKWLPGF